MREDPELDITNPFEVTDESQGRGGGDVSQEERLPGGNLDEGQVYQGL